MAYGILFNIIYWNFRNAYKLEFKYTLGRIFGYSRAVQIGNTIEVSGTTASEDDKVIGVGDVTLQTEYIIKKIEHTLVEAGFSLKDVVSEFL